MSAATDRRTARYTDGTPVREGDRIRYRQTPGGILPASPEWKRGTARKFPHTPEAVARIRAYNDRFGGDTLLDPDELYLFREETTGGYRPELRPAYFHIVGHIVERDTAALAAIGEGESA